MRRTQAVVLALALLGAAPGPTLLADLSAPSVEITSGYAGARLLVYGAIQYPRGRLPGEPPKLAVIARGPDQEVTVRRKARVGGVWVNAAAERYATAPSFFAISTTAPLDELVDERTAAVWELGLPFIQFSPLGAGDGAQAGAFQAGLIDLRRRAGLYQENIGAVRVADGILYRADIAIPAEAPVGEYSVTVHLIRDGAVVATIARELAVRKVGVEARISRFAERMPLVYGLATVAIAVATGWAASFVAGRR